MTSRFSIVVVALLAAAFAAAGMFWPPVQWKTPLTVAVGTWPGVEPIALADELDFIPESITIMEMPWPSATMRAFENGAADVAVLTLDEMLRLADRGHDLRAILVLDVSRGADAIVAKPEITSIKALRGRRIGVGLTSIGSYVLARALGKEGMTLADVQVVPLNVAESAGAFVEQSLDAVVTSEPFRSKVIASGGTEIFSSKELPGELVRVLAVRTEVLESRIPALEQLVDGHFKGLEKLHDGAPASAIEAIARRESLTVARLREVFSLLHQPDRAENARLLSEGPEGLQYTIEKIGQFLALKGVIKEPRKDQPWTDARFVQP
ncbi:ABC transporter substrate-binding protein [Roseimicrobium sp. ORNL1]|uniref:ABC transporter substrate-binding protein n=1 Tax=Roseimicrobium sp. ORNL1 TaxID=2711231 RepID=UPI0013E0F418|nr:ABC transporter substrate-binding protein [Roseimicrobium sp. ORNL1]QIF04541.1 ABC transporter substrate-binding protein [Roseimicrobium sp. ORNL1]